MSAFAPTPFSEPIVAPDTASLFRRVPYVSPGEYLHAPTAVATGNLVPGGSDSDNEAELANVISRASGWLDEICFHLAPGTLAASPGTESAWMRPKPNGELVLICNYKPILQVDGLALGSGPQTIQSMTSSEAQGLTIDGTTIRVPSCELPASESFGGTPTASNGKVYVVWSYVSGFPHSYLTEQAEEGAETITLAPAEPGGSALYGIYPGTQLTIHDGGSTEVIVVEAVQGLTLKLKGALAYQHLVPDAPNTVRVTAIPWAIEQACISLTSCLIKRRGARAMVMPTTPGAKPTGKQEESQPGGQMDYKQAMELLAPYRVPVLRS